MAALSNSDRRAVWALAMQDVSQDRETLAGLTKADFRAAIDAIDGWIDANAASFNTAIPQPARAALSAHQKAELFMLVIDRRWKVGD